MIKSEKELLDFVSHYGSIDAIVVEGFDGVGKGRVLTLLSDMLGVEPYRPDYNLWQQYDHRLTDRWKVSGFFWDVYSHFREYSLGTVPTMLFDRGVISGAVYNKDYTIADNYRVLLRDRAVLHILVTCTEEDYKKFAEVRNSKTEVSYEDYEEYTERYIECLDRAGVDYIIYQNKFNESEADIMKYICAGCGHYSYGYCRHPALNCKVIGGSARCKFSTDKEVQDATEMYSLQST